MLLPLRALLGQGHPAAPKAPRQLLPSTRSTLCLHRAPPGCVQDLGWKRRRTALPKSQALPAPARGCLRGAGTWRGLPKCRQLWFGSSGLCFPNSAAQEPSPRCRLPGGPSLAPLGWHLHEICHLSATIAPMCSAYHPLLQHICAPSSAHCPVSRPNPNRQLLIWPYKMSSSHRLQGKHGAPETGHSKLQPKGE